MTKIMIMNLFTLDMSKVALHRVKFRGHLSTNIKIIISIMIKLLNSSSK
jgi:hypothetical protein